MLFRLKAALLLLASQVAADCSDSTPVNASFDYPEYPLTVSDPGNEGVDKYRVCSRSTDFYTRNGYSSLDSSIEKSFHLIEESPLFIAVFGASPYPLTCLEALEHYDSIDPDTSVNPYPPPDDYIHSTAGIGGSDTNCCSALRYTTDLDIESEVSHNTVVLNIVEEYGDAQSEEFVTLCEELWACSSYVDQYSENRCEANESNLNRGCEPYVARTLCFNEAYNPTSEQEIKQRRAFIVESCFGAGGSNWVFDGNNEFKLSITDLTEDRDEQCQLASDFSDSLTFTLTPSDEALCDEIRGCVRDKINEIQSATVYTIDQFEPYDFCNEDDLDAEKARLCGDGSSDGVTYEVPPGDGPTCRALPTCPVDLKPYFTDFGPAYPPESGEYLAAMASINGKGLAIENGFDDRTTSDYYAIILIFKANFEAVLIGFDAIKDGLPDSWPYFWKVFVPGTLGAIVQSFDAVLKQADLHDGLIDAAEIEAIYENTRQMLDGSASIYDEVVCRCSQKPRRGAGCDSIDNDCDQDVDECDEDVFAPVIDIGQSRCQCTSNSGRQKWFITEQSAIDCVTSTVEVLDDCDADVQDVDSSLSGTCEQAVVALDATDRCNNPANTEFVPVYIDLDDPVVTCSVMGETDILVNKTGIGVQFDVALDYTATDNCGGDLDVKVDIYANEIEDFQSQEMAIFYKNSSDTANKRAGLFVATTYCSTGANGQCIKDVGQELRLYTVVVSATDPAGRTATPAECTILIIPQNVTGVDLDISKATQKFHLTSYSSTFTGV